MNLFIRAVIAAIAIFTLHGCTSVPMASKSEDVAAKQLQADPSRAVIYVYRESNFASYADVFPIAVADTIVGWLTPQSYVRVTVTPGFLVLSTLGRNNTLFDRNGGHRETLPFQVTVGKIYFVKMEPALGFVTHLTVTEAPEPKALQAMKLVRYDNRRLSLRDQLGMPWNPPKEDQKPERPVAAAIPSKPASPSPNVGDGIKQFAEIIGVVLLFGLLIFVGAEANSGGNHYTAPPTVYPSVYEQQDAAPAPRTAAPRSYITTSGDILQVSGNRVTSPTMGTSWTISGDSVHGTDGSNYQISNGGRIYSQDGRSFRVSGNHVYGDDGSLCTITGTLVNCN